LQFHLDLHLRLCDLDLAELPRQPTSEGQVFSLNFLNRRQEAITSLITLTEGRIIRLRSSLALHSVPALPPVALPSSSQSGMYKRLNSLKTYPVMTTGDVFWLDLQLHADANGLTTLNERLAHFHQAIVTDRPLMNWYENTIKPRLATLTLEDLQDLFFIQTLSPYWLSARLVKLCQISYRESELLRSFNSRFSSAAVNGKFDVHNPKP
jgi:hypothetical protein